MNAKKSELKCRNCQCWVKDTIFEGYGNCRRHPPFGENEKFPRTHRDCWCMEFIPDYESKDYRY